MTALAAATGVLLFYGFFYRSVVARWGGLAQWAMRRLRLDARQPVRHVEAVGKLAAAAVAQFLFAVVLAWGVGLHAEDVIGPGLHPTIIAAAIVLGVGELALTSLVCTIFVELSALKRPESGEAARREWMAGSRGGWMSYFLLTARAAPPAFAVGSICLYVATEELIFRGVLISTFVGTGAGAVLAVGGPAVLFVAVQPFAMPSRRAALFPMVGAAVVGIVHGVLFLHVPDVVPLAVAHIVFFGAAMSLAQERVPRPA